MVERFDLNEGGFLGERGHMEADPTGDYVRYSDYADLERQIAELRAQRDEARVSGHDSFKLACMWQDQAKTAEAENARLKALPLKDEVEREVGKLIRYLDQCQSVYRERSQAYFDEGSPLDKAVNNVRSLLSRLRAGEQEGWHAGKRRFAVQSPTGMHVGLWETKAFADAVAEEEGPGYIVIELIEIAASPSVSEGGSRNG